MAHTNARQTQFQQEHYFRKTVNFNDVGIGTGIYMGTLPAGAQVTSTSVNVLVVFNAVTTNVLTAGINGPSTNNNLVAAGDVDEASVALTNGIKPTGTALVPLAADSDILVMYTQTGTAATTGQAVIIVKYTPNNDS